MVDDFTYNQLEKEKIISRLRRIEGQIRGIQGMISKGRSCSEILMQITAVKSALNQVSRLLVENEVNSCIYSSFSSNGISREMINDIMEILLKFAR